jgi:hypothetical protein
MSRHGVEEGFGGNVRGGMSGRRLQMAGVGALGDVLTVETAWEPNRKLAAFHFPSLSALRKLEMEAESEVKA